VWPWPVANKITTNTVEIASIRIYARALQSLVEIARLGPAARDDALTIRSKPADRLAVCLGETRTSDNVRKRTREMPIGSTVDGPPINAPPGRWIAFKRNLRDHWPAAIEHCRRHSASVESCSYSTIAIVDCCPFSNSSTYSLRFRTLSEVPVSRLSRPRDDRLALIGSSERRRAPAGPAEFAQLKIVMLVRAPE
jgi:hypothetical protein